VGSSESCETSTAEMAEATLRAGSVWSGEREERALPEEEEEEEEVGGEGLELKDLEKGEVENSFRWKK
jgi:hypothetical protein